jgi:hypothetical protein
MINLAIKLSHITFLKNKIMSEKNEEIKYEEIKEENNIQTEKIEEKTNFYEKIYCFYIILLLTSLYLMSILHRFSLAVMMTPIMRDLKVKKK